MDAVLELKSTIIVNLKVYYKINEANAENVYNEALSLYHRLSTITNFKELKNVNDQILFALVHVIGHYVDYTQSSR